MIKIINRSLPKYTLTQFKKKTTRYCLCIPVINEGSRIKKQLKILAKYSNVVDIIICDGDSTDNSLSDRLLKESNVRLLLVKKDGGKLSAQLRMGYAHALKQGYEGVITMDGNGKDDPLSIPLFIEKLERGYDYIQGSRFLRKGDHVNTPVLRHIANRYFHAPLLSIASGYFWFSDTTNGFRAYSRRYLLDKRVSPFRKVFNSYELLAYLTVRAKQLDYLVCEVPVKRVYPKGKVPTKIHGFRGQIEILSILFKTCLRKYNP